MNWLKTMLVLAFIAFVALAPFQIAVAVFLTVVFLGSVFLWARERTD